MDASSGPAAGVSTSLASWFATPLGHYLLAREQAYFDQTVADIFGFHALQIGLPECPFLAQSRIPQRWTLDYDPPADIIADPHGLPFAENAVDLIVLPHALEFTDDPHLMLREAYRVIRPEGQIVIAGFNPFSLYGAKRYFGRAQTPPWNGSFIALYRLKDWLTLLGFDVVGGRLDAYAPPFSREKWLHRFGFFEAAGDRWWPIAGGVYYLRATKSVMGMRVVTPAWQRRERRKKALAPARARDKASRRRKLMLTQRRIEAWGSSSIPTGPAKAIPAPAAGARSCAPARTRRSSSAASRTRRTTAWSSPRSFARCSRSSAARDVELFTDSQYVKNGIETLDSRLARNGWKTADKKPVKNADLWRELDALVARHDVTWHWVSGHADDADNVRADALANRGVEAARR